MLYRFKSGATGDLIMHADRGDQLLELIGKAPAPSGIVTAAALPDAIRALERAVEAEEARPDVQDQGDPVTLRQRAWPLLDLFRRAQQAQVPVVWGV